MMKDKNYILTLGIILSLTLLTWAVVTPSTILPNAQTGVQDHDSHNAQAQPESKAPVPSGNRMFTEDKAVITRVTADPLIIEMVQIPKTLVANEPATFVMNLFHTNGTTWLWHSDFDTTVTNKDTGEKMLIMPNIHGHGSMAQFSYTFPEAGRYDISVVTGQQAMSPNYIKPKVVREGIFTVNVEPGQQAQTQTAVGNVTANPVKEIPVQVKSWGFSPNKIEVNRGDLVRLSFTTANDEVALYNGHGFGIEKYNVNVFLVKGTNQEVEFVADKPGTYTFRCTSFCATPTAPEENHFNMVGTFVVK
jgi:heme/copper-type cytochrome/quinol oxidase subunit 2